MDTVDVQTRSRMMANIRGKNTKPELIVRKYLHSLGFRFRLHVSKLPGSPDIVLPKYKVALFVHGCFWHQHERCAIAYMPKDNVKWTSKLLGNKARDLQNLELLQTHGWRVIIIWECGLRAIKKDASKLAWLGDAIKTDNRTRIEWPEI